MISIVVAEVELSEEDVFAVDLVDQVGVLGTLNGQLLSNVEYSTLNYSGADLKLGGGEGTVTVEAGKCQ